MKITNTMITTHAVKETQTAKYNIEYKVDNGKLSAVSASVSELPIDEHGNNMYIGNLYFENEIVSSSLPVTANLAEINKDFCEIISEIEKAVQEG